MIISRCHTLMSPKCQYCNLPSCCWSVFTHNNPHPQTIVLYLHNEHHHMTHRFPQVLSVHHVCNHCCGHETPRRHSYKFSNAQATWWKMQIVIVSANNPRADTVWFLVTISGVVKCVVQHIRKDLDKGHFPHKFNTANEYYVGSYPDLSFDGYETTCESVWTKFMAWYQTVVQKSLWFSAGNAPLLW